jgi:phage portal protein BeeE
LVLPNKRTSFFSLSLNQNTLLSMQTGQPSRLNVFQKLAIKAFGINKLPGFSNTLQAIVGGSVAWDGQNLHDTITKGYAGNGTVYSILRLIIDKVKEAPWAEYEVVDKTLYAEYKKARELMGKKDGPTLRQVKALQNAALRPVKAPSKISMLLANPNPDDTFNDIIEQMAMYKLATGNTYVMAKLLEMGPNTGMPQEIYVLPSQWMQVITDLNKFPLSPIGYKLMYGENQVFVRAQILHDKYPNPNYSTTGQHLIGLSPMEAGYRELTRDNSGKTRAVKSYDHGGPPGIISIDADRDADGAFLQAQVDELKARVAEYEGAYNPNKPAFSGYKTIWTPLGLSPVDLGLSEVEGYNTDALCNLWGVPSELLNRHTGRGMNGAQSGNSKNAAERALTVRCALPLLNSFRDQFNRKFAKEWGGIKTVLDYDPSGYTELEADRKDQAIWLNTAWWIPPQMKFEQMGLDIPDYLNKEDLQQIILPNTMQPLDMADAPPLPNDLNPYKQNPPPA